MDWSKELIESAIWISKSLGITAVIFTLVMWLLIRFTHWGRQFWAMAKGYLTPKRSIKPILFFTFIGREIGRASCRERV